ncbi:hypothetical protein YC2023_054399 [Brassica napus]
MKQTYDAATRIKVSSSDRKRGGNFLDLILKSEIRNLAISIINHMSDVSRKMKIKVRRFARSDYESDFSKVSSQLTTEVLFEVQLVFQGVFPCLLAS